MNHNNTCSCNFVSDKSLIKVKRSPGVNIKLKAVWSAMKDRCLNNKCKYYRYYGGRGIYVCSQWVESLQCFVNDMGDSDGKTLDRTDNNRGYCPHNCRWVSMADQLRNRRPFVNKGSADMAILKKERLGFTTVTDSKKFTSSVHFEKKRYYLGLFETRELAQKAYRLKFYELYGFYPKLKEIT